MILIKITCIKKLNQYSRYEAITHLGRNQALLYTAEYWTVEDAIKAIQAGTHQFYTEINGEKSDIIVVSDNDRMYLRTRANNIWNDNLLELPECSNRPD